MVQLIVALVVVVTHETTHMINYELRIIDKRHAPGRSVAKQLISKTTKNSRNYHLHIEILKHAKGAKFLIQVDFFFPDYTF